MTVLQALALSTLMVLGCGVALSQPANDSLSDLALGRWVKVHEQRPGDAVHFQRQRHAGSAFDTRRGRLILFGSDTHDANGEDWANSPLFFDTGRLEWRRLYPDDDPSSYAVNSRGIPVAGKHGEHPWAMHTFGAVVYDTAEDQLIVSSCPCHLEPGRYTEAVDHLWPYIRRHPTWVLDLSSGKWTFLPGKAVHFFPYATAYDSDRNVVIGYKSSGIYELGGRPRKWERISDKGLLGYHNNAVYDNRNKALVVFGSNGNSNDIVVYEPSTRQHKRMPTPGERPPAAQHSPMAFHPRLGKTVVVVDHKLKPGKLRDLRKRQAETWLYDLALDRWSQVGSATLSFGLGMNYGMEYDPGRNILLLVANAPDQPTAVWALRL